MVLCGHKLTKDWYKSLKWRVEFNQILIDEFSQFLNNERTAQKARERIKQFEAEIQKERENLELFIEAVKSLGEKERKVASYIYLEGQTIEAIADKMGYSTQHINRIKNKAREGLEAYITKRSGGK